MELVVQRRSRLFLFVALAVAVVAALAFARPAGGAIPAGSVIGKVTYTDLVGTTDVTTTIRSFTIRTEIEPASGGAGTSKASFGMPRVIQDVIAHSPSILAGLVASQHYPAITVTLYRPSSTTRFQQWTFADAQLTLDDQTQKGPASATPQETVSWAYERVRQTTYKSDGSTVLTTYCFDVATNSDC